MRIRNRVRTIEKLKRNLKNFLKKQGYCMNMVFLRGRFHGLITLLLYVLSSASCFSYERYFSKKHSGVTSAFGQHFTKIGLLPADLHFKILRGFEERNISDYGFETPKTAEEAKEILGFAVDFAKAVVPFLDDWIEEHKD